MVELIIGGIQFDDSCPVNCPGRSGGMAYCPRCPKFCCIPDHTGFCLIDAADYRPDWAAAWAAWFAGGMTGYPELSLNKKEV